MLRRAFLLAVLLAFPALPQQPPAPSGAARSTLEVKPGEPAIKDGKVVAPWKRLPRYLLSDQKAIWTSPFHTSKKDSMWWGIFGGATIGLIAGDKYLSDQLPNTNDQLKVARWTSRVGAIYTLLPITGGIYFLGAKTNSDHLRETSFLGFEALANAGLVSVALKTITRRERPTQGNGRGDFFSSTASPWNAGFPSGHAIESWALASVFAHEYPRPRWVPIVAYGLATTISGSRFAARRHFAADVIAGAAMGWFIGDYVYAKRHNAAVSQSTVRKVLSHVRLGFSIE